MMSLQYVCRYCYNQIGVLDQTTLDMSHLGLDQLTQEEKERIIHDQPNGDIVVQVICEHCQDTLQRHPEFILYSVIHQ